jgi:hypothetical protein
LKFKKKATCFEHRLQWNESYKLRARYTHAAAGGAVSGAPPLPGRGLVTGGSDRGQ